VDCGDLVSDLRNRIESGENLDLIIADLEYGVMAELEEFERRLLIILTETMEGTDMVNTDTNGLSTNSQQAKIHFLSFFIAVFI
jgi:citrate lyase beta subunit